MNFVGAKIGKNVMKESMINLSKLGFILYSMEHLFLQLSESNKNVSPSLVVACLGTPDGRASVNF